MQRITKKDAREGSKQAKEAKDRTQIARGERQETAKKRWSERKPKRAKAPMVWIFVSVGSGSGSAYKTCRNFGAEQAPEQTSRHAF